MAKGYLLVDVEELGCENLAELDALLVKRIDVPQESLVGNLVLVEGEKCSHSVGVELFAEDEAVGPVSIEALVGVAVDAPSCHGKALGKEVRVELLLRRRALDVEVLAELALSESDKLAGDRVGALQRKCQGELVEAPYINRLLPDVQDDRG